VRRLALVCALLLSLSACNQKNQAEQLAALDSAKQSGVLTEQEYEAKRAALLGSSAAAPAPAATVAPPVTPVTPAPAAPEPAAELEPAPSTGCDDVEYKSHKNGPQSRFFAMPVAQVKQAALKALTTLDFKIHKESGNEIEASKKRHASAVIGAGGEREILQLEPAQQGGQRGTRVTGETKRNVVVGRVTQKSWTAAVLAQIACNLK
jgi:hypothetical protein